MPQAGAYPPTRPCRRGRPSWKARRSPSPARRCCSVLPAGVTKVGGNVLSSQLDLQGTQSKAGFLSDIAGCSSSRSACSRLLYDLEAAMPFLFVDQLTVQAPTSSAGEGKLRILLAVSGQWRGAK